MNQTSRRIRVLVVDDSAIVRQVLSQALAKHDDIEVVATAMDPYVARDKIVQLKPDVLTLDLQMPRMDGLTFLKILMQHQPMPVVVVSSLTGGGQELAMQAIQAGAVEVVSKPSNTNEVRELSCTLADQIRAAAKAVIKTHPALNPNGSSGNITAPAKPIIGKIGSSVDRNLLVAIGASTGGTEALAQLISSLPEDFPPVVIVQHMPKQFTPSFAERLNRLSAMKVSEAKDGDMLCIGQALLAPGDLQMQLQKQANGYAVRVQEGPRVNRHRPSVDVLFHSVATLAASNAIGVILTGMGNDGAQGMLEMKNHGAINIAQDEASCVVFGMPKEAIDLGAADLVLPLPEIAGKLVELVKRRVMAAAV